MSKTEPRSGHIPAADDEWTAVDIRDVIDMNGSLRLTVTKAKDEIGLGEGDSYLIKTRDDGSILLVPQ